MSTPYKIADLEIGGNVIKIDVTANDDGSLQIFDWSCGPVADMFFGEDRDVESWIDLTAEATRQLSVVLFKTWVDTPAASVAQHLAETHKGDSKALSKIKALLDANHVPYEKSVWP
jgi:hypothetical protein